MSKDGNADKNDEPKNDARALPFMKRVSGNKSSNPLLDGKTVKASASYRRLRVRRRPVNPVRWQLSVAPQSETDKGSESATAVAWQADEDEEEQEQAAFRVKLYRRDAKTGELEVFEQSYSSEQEYTVALTRKLSDGYTRTPPAAAASEKKQPAKAKADPASKKEADKDSTKDKKTAKNSCPVQVTWTTGEGKTRKEHSRCFQDRASAKAFQDQRRKALEKSGRP